MPAETHAVRAEALVHRYRRTLALDHASMTIPQGAAVAVVGPDGVGKSTLLGLIAGARRLQAGRLEVLGARMDRTGEREQVAGRIAYMPQGLGKNLYPTLSVAENLDFIGRLHGVPRAARAERIDRLLRATGLDPFPDRPAGKLSGGMRQKLGLCAALLHDPDLLVLDEPTTGVDPLSRRQFWALIDRLRTERPQMTVMVATAYWEEAERFERLIAIDRGRILAEGETRAIVAGSGAASLEDAYRRLQAPTSGAVEPFVMPPRPADGDGPAIVARGLTQRFGDFVAVDDVSFRIERGEVFGFLGSNGCGKTTTMKMLTGLLPPSSGEAELLGRPVRAADVRSRERIGYMSQGFSLYEELSVRGNLELHARLYRLGRREGRARVEEALVRFGLAEYARATPAALPLGIRQRLQLATACLHQPEVLILDEPTSGVDPAARDQFWRLLAELSREQRVTIFISTHFMNEAMRCDRISLMHAGRVLAVGTAEEITAAAGAASLEDAFVHHLEAAGAGGSDAAEPGALLGRLGSTGSPLAVSFGRIWAFARRELVETWRDRVRLGFALGGPLMLLLTFGYGINFDVERLRFSVLDRDRSADSRELVWSIAGSRYFDEQAPVADEAEADRRLRAGALNVVLQIPPGFGRDLARGQAPELGFLLDGSMPFRAETARGYLDGIVQNHVAERELRAGRAPAAAPFRVEPRMRYNQSFESVQAIMPGTIMILLLIIPAMLAALGVVRERDTGSYTNLTVSPASVGEFLIGKQLAYTLVGTLSFMGVFVLATQLFGLDVKGSGTALALGGILYLLAATGWGLVIGSLLRSQVAAIIGTAILCVVPAINFSGYLHPVGSLEGAGWWIGHLFPALWFQGVSVGVFAKALGWRELLPNLMALLAFAAVLPTIARLLLKKQER